MKEEKYKISAEIDLTKEPQEVRVEGTEDVWFDLGLWLETTAFVAHKAMKYREWDKSQILNYCADYLRSAIGEVK